MSYTRGQETFWNNLVITAQNLARLFWVCVLFTILSFSISFYLMTPTSLWEYTGKGFQWLKSIAQTEGVLIAFARLSELLEYLKGVFMLHGTEAQHSLIVSIILSTTGYSLLVLYFNKRGKYLSKDEHVSGAKLITAKEFTRAVDGLIKDQQKEIKADTKGQMSTKSSKAAYTASFICTADKIQIPADLLSTHIAAIGATGTGKTTVIQHRIEHAKNCGHKGIVLDINGELYSKVGNEDDIILSLFDTRSSFWDYQFESYRNLAVSPMEIAEYLVPKENVDDSVWWKAPRIILEDLFPRGQETCRIENQKNIHS